MKVSVVPESDFRNGTVLRLERDRTLDIDIVEKLITLGIVDPDDAQSGVMDVLVISRDRYIELAAAYAMLPVQSAPEKVASTLRSIWDTDAAWMTNVVPTPALVGDGSSQDPRDHPDEHGLFDHDGEFDYTTGHGHVSSALFIDPDTYQGDVGAVPGLKQRSPAD